MSIDSSIVNLDGSHFHGEFSPQAYLAHALARGTLKSFLGRMPLTKATAAFVRKFNEPLGDLKFDSRLRREFIDGGNWRGVHLSTRGVESEEAIVYFHGGCFFAGGVGTHKRLIEELALRHGCHVFAIEYRKWPEVTLEGTYEDSMEALALVLNHFEAKNVVLAGDSAGGGIAVETAGRFLNRGVKFRGLALMSPWLDFTVGEEGYRRYEERDAYIPAKRVPEVAARVLGRKPREGDSPIDALGNGFPPVLFIVSANEVLRVDSERAYARCRELGVPAALHYFSGGVHAFPVALGFFPESREALKVVDKFVASLRETPLMEAPGTVE